MNPMFKHIFTCIRKWVYLVGKESLFFITKRKRNSINHLSYRREKKS